MKPRFFLWTVSLAAVLVASACASATTVPAAPTDAVIPATAAPINPSAPEATASVPLEAPVQAVATSRGDNLEATDPTTVSLASGQLQLVEFFRFT